MTDRVGLTCAQVPLAWPSSVSLQDVKPCSTCGIQVFSPASGTLQLSSRPARDGITIAESSGAGADYQGQRYTIDECVFHTPGLHVFPGQSDVYPAEYHIYMTSVSLPIRTIVVVIPLSHRSQDNGEAAGTAYFAAAAAQPSTPAPLLTTLLPPGSPVLQYYAGDIRNCDPAQPDIQYLLSLRVMAVRASDLERIPREGTGSTLPDALPLPGPKPTQAIPRDVLLRNTLLATPGILSGAGTTLQSTKSAPRDLDPSLYTCNPVQVKDGKDVIVSQVPGVPLPVILDICGGSCAPPDAMTSDTASWIYGTITFVMTFVGLLVADWFFSFFWGGIYGWGGFFSEPQTRINGWLHMKLILFIVIAISSIYWPTGTRDTLYGILGYIF